MEKKRVFTIIGLLLIILTLVLAACGGGDATSAPEVADIPADQGSAEEQAETEASTDDATADEPDIPESTLTPEEMFPEILVLHPDAMDVQANPASGTYVYIVPMMVQETTDYLLAEMTALGWGELGKPTVMGHLATINMQMDKTRVTISMQDNERSQTTRVQMLLLTQ